MKKTAIKILTVLFVFAALSAALALFSACGNKNNEDESGNEQIQLYGTWDEYEGLKIAFMEESVYNYGYIDETKILPELDCVPGKIYYMVIDFEIQADRDNDGTDSVTAEVRLTPSSLIGATIHDTETGNVKEETINGITTLSATYKIPESAESVRNIRLAIQLTPLAQGAADIGITFKNSGEVKGVRTETAAKSAAIGYTEILVYAGNTVTGLSDKSLTEVIIPNMHDGYYVTSIESGAFENCTSLTSITIPDGVTSIGDRAFQNCTALTEINYNATACADLSSNGDVFSNAGQNGDGITVNIGANVKKIPSFLFRPYSSSSYSPKIVSVVFKEGGVCKSIGSYAFAYCTSLTSINIPDSVTSIGSGAFEYCTSLASIEIPDGVTSIGSSAFYGCTSLTSVTIGNGVTSIGSSAFKNCTNLTSVTIGKNVTSTSIGDYAFYNCYKLIEVYNLSSLTITKGFSGNGYAAHYVAYYAKDVYTSTDTQSKLTTTDDGYIFYDDTANDNGYYLMGYTGNATSLTLPDKYNSNNYSIYQYAFYNCTSLESITIPDGVTSIGSSAFYGCHSLTSITILDSVTSIGSDSFSNTAYYNDENNWGNGVLYIGKHLIAAKTSISGAYEIESGTLTIAGSAFYKCTSLTSVTIGSGVTSIGDSAFSGCILLKSVTIPDSVTSMGSSAFSSCTSLTSVTIGNGVESIGSSAFYKCTSLKSVTIGSGVTSIGYQAFYGCTALTSIDIPDGVTSIGTRAFEGCTSLTSVTIGSGVTSIGTYAFSGCTRLKSANIPDGVTSIEYRAFYDCSSLTSVEIPDGVTSIGGSAFYGCSSLQSINIPDGVTSIGSSAFEGCNKLTEINYNATECADLIYGNRVFSFAGNRGEGITVNIGATVKKIPAYLFYPHYDDFNNDSPNIVSVIFAEDSQCTSIGSGAFYNCTSLTSITIPDGVTSIGSRAFQGCTALESVTIGDGVTSIGYEAFENCTSLKSITIPDSVTSIEYRAFYGCTSLTSVTFENTNGWWYANGSDATSGTSIPSNDLANTSKAATYLTSTYCSYYWKRS